MVHFLLLALNVVAGFSPRSCEGRDKRGLKPATTRKSPATENAPLPSARRGGCAVNKIDAKPPSSAQPGAKRASAPIRMLRGICLMSRPRLLAEEGNLASN